MSNDYKVTYKRSDDTLGERMVYNQPSKQDAGSYISIVLGVKILSVEEKESLGVVPPEFEEGDLYT